MRKKKKHSPLGKIIIGTVAILFFLYGGYLSVLWLVGTPIQAKITNFRREMGERDETIRNQYTYSYSYEFSVSEEKYSGNSKKVQGPIFLKNQGSNFISIHYLGCCPALNCPKDDFKPWYKVFIYYVISLVVGYFYFKMN